MEGINDTPAKVTDNNTEGIAKTQDENTPINDNGAFHGNSKTAPTESKDKPLNEKSSANISEQKIEDKITEGEDDEKEDCD